MIKLGRKYVMDLFDVISQGQMKVADENNVVPTPETIYHTGLAIGFIGLTFAMKEEGKTKEDVLRDVSEALDKFLAGKSFLEIPKDTN